ncbi:MAG: hypothetical protein HKN50_08670 [Gammaproteobacteria bacterium]|nr:hypothetical protein [Gammaproteobacteria bacterium]
MNKLLNNVTHPSLRLAVTLLATIALSAASGTALAKKNGGTFFGKEAKGKWIIGVKAAKIDSNVEEVNDADAKGIVLGYEFDRVIGDSGGTATVELEYVQGDDTVIDGFGSYEANMLNLFMTYRTAGTIYFKAKGGASYSDLTITTVAFQDTLDSVSLVGGIGLGYRIGDYGAVEVEYTDDTGDNDLGLIGFNAMLEF